MVPALQAGHLRRQCIGSLHCQTGESRVTSSPYTCAARRACLTLPALRGLALIVALAGAGPALAGIEDYWWAFGPTGGPVTKHTESVERGEHMTSKPSVYRINSIGEHPTVRYAAEELRRCLAGATGRQVEISVGEIDPEAINVGLTSAFAGVEAAVGDPEVDDVVDIDVRGGKGRIAGVNPRSALLAAYRYLTEVGCRWVRPGPDGEYIPRIESLPDVRLREAASYRHRGICIEGSVGMEHLKDLVEWMPRVGFNGYFTQFREAHTFFDRWYGKGDNLAKEPRTISIDEARGYIRQTVQELEKRDLLYHAVGHGWTCEPFGISGMGWEKSEEPPESVRQYFAQVNGERKLWGGVAINTNLCYGNRRARRLIAEEIANYAEKHPEIDIIHFWLADGSNNNCECEMCKDTRPSDFYVMTLNELDEIMTKKGLKTRIVFLIYVDLLWPPEREKIANPDRFILMFAPITRTYSSPFTSSAKLPELPPFVRNKLEFPKQVEQNIAFLRAWQKDFHGDSFDFDYHLIWDHYLDPGYVQVADILCRDIKALKDIGLNGYVSCQVQRAFFPTGLPMTVLGRTLWNRGLSFDEISRDYFASAYGPDGKLAREYLTKISELFDPSYMRGEKPRVSPEAAQRLARIPGVIEDFGPVIERNIGGGNQCWSKSWEYLRHHARFYELFSRACEAAAKDDRTTAARMWEEAKAYIVQNHSALHPVFDVWMFLPVAGGPFRAG